MPSRPAAACGNWAFKCRTSLPATPECRTNQKPGRSCNPPPRMPRKSKSSVSQFGIGRCRFSCGSRMTDLGWCMVQKRGRLPVGCRTLSRTDVEAVGRLPTYHSCSPSRDTARADAILASARRTEGVGLEHGPYLFCVVSRYDSSEC